MTSEIEWIKKAQQGDQVAFRYLVQLHASQVQKTAIGMLGEGPEAEDVAQEVFIRFHKAMHKFEGEAKLATYLHRIAINLSLNALNKRKRRQFFRIPLNKQTVELVANFEDRNENPERSDLKSALEFGLDQLEPVFRAVVVLRLQQGYSLKETAEMLQIPEGTVASRLMRAQKKLRKILNNYL